MPLSEQALRSYIAAAASVELSDASIARVSTSLQIAGNGLQALAAESLFDSEPEHLHSVLEALADVDPG